MEKTIEITMSWCANCGKLMTKKREHCPTCREFAKSPEEYKDALEAVRELQAKRHKRQVREN